MRSVAHLLLPAALFLGACTSEPAVMSGARETALMEEVARTVQAFTEAMNAHDPDRIFSFYRQDPSFFYLGCTDVLSGWGNYESRVRPYYTFNTDVEFHREILNVQILSPTTAAVALRGGSSEAEHLFWSLFLQRVEDGTWLVTHEHESWPGCRVPRGPHMGTGGMPGTEMSSPDTGSQGN